jgi:hypothetical protein
MSDKKDETVVEAAQATTEKLWAQPARKFNLPTPGEYFAAMHIGGTTFENVARATKEFVKANQSALQAAAGDITTTDTPGLLPIPVLGVPFARSKLSIDQLLQRLALEPCQTTVHQKHLCAQQLQRTHQLQRNQVNLPQHRQPQWLLQQQRHQNNFGWSSNFVNSRRRLHRPASFNIILNDLNWRILDCIRQRRSRRNYSRRYSVRCNMGSYSRRPNNFD